MQPAFYMNDPQINFRQSAETSINAQILNGITESKRIVKYSPSNEVSAVRYSSNGLNYNF